MSLENAEHLYAKAEYKGALREALDSAKGADAGFAYLIAAKCLVALYNFDGLGKIVGFAQQNGAAPERTFFRILHDCLADKIYQPLVALDRVVPDSSIFHPIALYHASCARMMLSDDVGAANGFDRFRLEMPRYLNSLPFGTDDEFNVIFRQGTLVLPPERTAARIASGVVFPASQEEIRMVRSPETPGSGPIVMCCADARYIEYFLAGWIAPLARLDLSLHIHVVNPDHNSRAVIDRLTDEFLLASRLSASVSSDRLGTATSYACARFETVPVLLELFQRPILALDIDVAATEALASLASSPFGADFACFETGRCEPASLHQASIMAFAYTSESIGFVRDLAAYCRPKLRQPVRLNWMLDQAALFSVIRLYRGTKPGFSYLALDRTTGHPLSNYIVGLASDEEKHLLKGEKAGLDSGSPDSGEVDILWEP